MCRRLLLLVLVCHFLTSVDIVHAVEIEFARDVQPILRRHCNRCHGEKNQEADLQLNLRSSVLGEANSSESIIVRRDSNASLLIQRLVDPEYGDLMPLDSDPLSPAEIETLRRWIDQGAEWPDSLAEPKHWAYQPIKRSVAPSSVTHRSTIDHFVQQRLSHEGLQLSPPLDRPRLIRRVSLALTGIPPTPAEVQSFVNDSSEDAYEKVVDRLLQSPRYGERWAVPWLDAARYADSNGFQADQIRDNWAYRDWVIRAFNDGMPIDQFVIEQLAGDLLENPTADQRVATGFHRMTTCNVEAGVHPEANRVNQVVDRVNTTATVFLGTTLECAQCHDHKYDPFTQRDYYQLFAYFNNTPLEVKNTSGVTWDFYGPTMDLPMEETLQRQLAAFESQLDALKASRKELIKAGNDEFESWLTGLRRADRAEWVNVVPAAFRSTGNEEFAIQSDGAVLLSGDVPDKVQYVFTLAPQAERITAIRVDALVDDSVPGKGPGRGDPVKTNIILSEVTCEWVTDKESGGIELLSAAADHSQKGWDISRAIDGDPKTGWAIAPEFGKPHWASFQFAEPLAFDSTSQQLRVNLVQNFGRGRVMAKPRISVFSGDVTYLNLSDEIRKIGRKTKLNQKDRTKLRAEFQKSNPKLQELDRQIERVTKQMKEVEPDTTLVMVEMEDSRETFVMIRGDYENQGDLVQPRPPVVLPRPTEIERTGDRLELARWLTSKENPLFPRVTVNRWWSELFGVGLVNTPEDFGTQADSPSHPEVLDWLASELMESDWSMKHVHKLIVMSETFQQSARVSPELIAADPNNRWLSRGPRFRLSAELVRDNALAISGLLSDKMFGPPIMPFQPDNIWRSVGRNQPKWVAAQTEDRFRRGLYVVWKRAAPYPSFVTFDAPDRGSCTVNRGRSNTPLQAFDVAERSGLCRNGACDGRSSDQRIAIQRRSVSHRLCLSVGAVARGQRIGNRNRERSS